MTTNKSSLPDINLNDVGVQSDKLTESEQNQLKQLLNRYRRVCW